MLKNLTAALIVAGIMTTTAFAQGVDVKSAINDLSNRSGSVRQNAVMMLGSANDKSVVSNIESLAYDSDPGVRTAVCWALGQFKSPTSENILNSLARDSKPEVRQAAVNALGNYKSVTTGETLVRATYDSDVNVRKSAINSLAIVKYEHAGSRLTALLSDSNPDVRTAAAIAMKSMNYNAPSSIVATGLKDPDSRVRTGAAQNLGTGGREDAISLLTPGLKDLNPAVRSNAATSLGETKNDKAIPYLITSLGDRTDSVGISAAAALANVGPTAVPQIVDKLESSENRVQKNCIRALAGMGGANVDLLSEYSKRPELREISIWGLGETKSPKAYPAVFDGFSDNDEKIQQTAAEAMGKLGTAVLPDLKKEMENPNEKVRLYMAKAVGYMPYAKESAEFLVDMMKDDKETVAAEASVSLSRYGNFVKPLLLETLKSDDEMQRTGAINALALMGQESAPALRECLKDKSAKVRAGAALGLGQMGDKVCANEIVQLFENDNNPEVKRSCAWTIGKICEPSEELMKRLVLEKTRAGGKKLPALQKTIEDTIRIFESKQK